MMQVTAHVSHRCPFVDEQDYGVLTLVFPTRRPELHTLRRFLDSFVDEKISHEDLVDRVKSEYPSAHVAASFTTAGMDVEVTA